MCDDWDEVCSLHSDLQEDVRNISSAGVLHLYDNLCIKRAVRFTHDIQLSNKEKRLSTSTRIDCFNNDFFLYTFRDAEEVEQLLGILRDEVLQCCEVLTISLF